MTNTKHIHLLITQFNASIVLSYFGPGVSFLKILLWLLMRNFERDSNVTQHNCKTENSYLHLYVAINFKYLFIFYAKAKLLYILFVCFYPSINETFFICAEEGGCDLSQHIDIDLPDYTVSHRRRPK